MTDWISVTKGVPDNSGDVLIVDAEDVVNLGYKSTVTGLWMGYFLGGAEPIGRFDAPITHWMPLPPAPARTPVQDEVAHD